MTTGDPIILAIATAVPPFQQPQEATREAARAVFGPRMRDFERLAPVFMNAGIATRHTCQPLDWYREPRNWPEKNAAYLDGALALMEQATRSCLLRAGLTVADVAAIVVVSSTGIATPSLDSLLMERMGFAPETQRLPIFGLGCCGGVLGLARAAALARAMPGGTVLCVVVELCSLAVRTADLRPTNIVATALFADGAAAALIRADRPGAVAESGAALVGWGEHTWPGTRAIMGWSIETDGLGVIFSQDIPMLVQTRLRPAADAFLARHGLMLADLAGTVCHPGGVKVLSALETALAPCTAGFDDAWAVLRDFGNMSAVTVLFVLERRLARNARGRHLMTALGPGFTAGFLLVDL